MIRNPYTAPVAEVFELQAEGRILNINSPQYNGDNNQTLSDTGDEDF